MGERAAPESVTADPRIEVVRRRLSSERAERLIGFWSFTILRRDDSPGRTSCPDGSGTARSHYTPDGALNGLGSKGSNGVSLATTALAHGRHPQSNLSVTVSSHRGAQRVRIAGAGLKPGPFVLFAQAKNAAGRSRTHVTKFWVLK